LCDSSSALGPNQFFSGTENFRKEINKTIKDNGRKKPSKTSYPQIITYKQIRAYLDEANFLGVAAEALSAAHETILPDYGMRIPANTAA